MEIFNKYDEKKEQQIFDEQLKKKERVSVAGKVVYNWNKGLEGLRDKIKRMFNVQ